MGQLLINYFSNGSKFYQKNVWRFTLRWNLQGQLSNSERAGWLIFKDEVLEARQGQLSCVNAF